MLAKIMSAVALTLLLTGGALAYIPQPHNIHAGLSNKRLPVVVADDETVLAQLHIRVIDGPGRRKAAGLVGHFGRAESASTLSNAL
jgi:hypothetical protein